MHAIIFLYKNAIDFHFGAVKTWVLRVDSFILKINLPALLWISSRSWIDFEDPHRAIECETLRTIPLTYIDSKMCLSGSFKCFSFLTLAEKRLLKDFTWDDRDSLLSFLTPKQIALITKDSSFGHMQMFWKGPIKVDLDNSISSVFAGWIVIHFAQLFNSMIVSWMCNRASSKVCPMQKYFCAQEV